MPCACAPVRVRGPIACGSNLLSRQITRTRKAVGIPFARAADSSIKQSEERDAVAAAPASPVSGSKIKTVGKIERTYRIANRKDLPVQFVPIATRPIISCCAGGLRCALNPDYDLI
jgi:hypothetical protein